MTTVYLDVDDEITSAASRMRASAESRVVLVLPAGSRLGTSRINFRLLAREAATNGRSLSIVSPEAATRALAASAGLPVFASVFEQEAAAEAAIREPEAGAVPVAAVGAVAAVTAASTEAGTAGAGMTGAANAGGTAEGSPGSPGSPGTASSATATAFAAGSPAGAPGPAPGDAAAQRSSAVPGGAFAAASSPRSVSPIGPPTSVVTGPTRGRSRPRAALLVGLGVLVLAVIAAGVVGYLVLPSATVRVVVRPEPLGPLDMTVTADPAASAPDPSAGVVPAVRPTLDLASSGTFPATGKKVTDTQATGGVRWENCDPTSSYTIPRGTVVRTRGGVGFATDETVFLPVAILNLPSISCQSRDVGVTATAAGDAGNVDARTITVVPPAYNSVVVRVSNPAPTTGGSHTETKLVSQKDVDAAKKALTAKLDAQLRTILADPTQLPPGQAFPDTAARTAPAFDPDPAGLVGQEIDGFDLAASATGSVTVVDETAVTRMAEAALVSSVPAGERLVPGSTRVDLGEPTVQGQAVRYPISASARTVTPVDPSAVRAAVAGKPVEEARTALGAFGDGTIELWPSWASAVPTYDFRLDVQVVTEGEAGASPSPSGSDTGPGGTTPSSSGATSTSPSATP